MGNVAGTQDLFLGMLAFPEPDARTKNWPMMQSFLPTLAICVLYLLTIQVGIIQMKNRTAFKLLNFVRCYNILTVAINAYILYEFFYVVIHEALGFCSGVDTDPTNVNSLRLAAAIWWYYLSKAFGIKELYYPKECWRIYVLCTLEF